MRLTLVNPRLVVQKGDFLGSGVPYWPIELATLAAHVDAREDNVAIIDLFGQDPRRLSDCGNHYLQGVPIEEHVASEPVRCADAFILYALSYMSHLELVEILRTIRAARADATIAILENTQAVTAYSLPRVSSDFFAAGADALICGEPYVNWHDIREYLSNREAAVPVNVMTPAVPRVPSRITERGFIYPVPAWDLFNLAGYWSLPYSHGPKTRRFLPLLTSRGCPYPCDFCVVPETTARSWRSRRAEEVVDEIMTLRDRFDVRDFQIEDLNPTVNTKRWDEITRELGRRQAQIRWYLVSGTKAETVHIDQVPPFAVAGCRYISISPESGSARLMKVIGKSFDYEHGIRLISACRAYGIRTQACFLVGHPKETVEDFSLSCRYLAKLVAAGLDEVAVFIVAPFAGSALYAQGRIDIDDTTAVPSFSPRGRRDFRGIRQRRRRMLWIFFAQKLRRGPALWAQGLRALIGRPQTKMENLPRRVGYILWLIARAKIVARPRRTN